MQNLRKRGHQTHHGAQQHHIADVQQVTLPRQLVRRQEQRRYGGRDCRCAVATKPLLRFELMEVKCTSLFCKAS